MPAAMPPTVPQMQNSPTVLHNRAVKSGAGTKSRTRDPLITSQVLYQLSYTGKESELCRQLHTLARNLFDPLIKIH